MKELLAVSNVWAASDWAALFETLPERDKFWVLGEVAIANHSRSRYNDFPPSVKEVTQPYVDRMLKMTEQEMFAAGVEPNYITLKIQQ